MKKIYLTLLSCFIAILTTAQTPGFSYQAVILQPVQYVPALPGNTVEQGLLSESEIAIRFTIENELGTEYQETHATKTDAYGMVNLMVGQGIATIGNFTDVAWVGTEKYLKVEIDFTASGASYENLDRQALTYLPQPVSHESMAIIDQINTDVSNNNDAIQNEIIRATTSEQANTDALDSEIARATTAEQANTTAISDEITRAITAEGVNAAAIANETTRAMGTESYLDNNVQANTAAITTNASAITAEENRALSAEQANATNLSANTAAIVAETARATTAEGVNATAISANAAGVSINIGAINANTGAISNIASDISTANANISSNESAITAEENRATAAEQANAAAIATNASDISTANTNISSNASAIAAEENRAIATEQANANAISTNASDISTANANIGANATGVATNATDIATNTANITNLANSGSGPIFHQSTSSDAEITYSTSYVDMSLIVTTSPTNSGTSNCLISFSGTLTIPNQSNNYGANGSFLINVDGVDILSSRRISSSTGYRSVSTIYYATNVPDGAVIKVRQANAQGVQNYWSKPTLIVQQYPN